MQTRSKTSEQKARSTKDQKLAVRIQEGHPEEEQRDRGKDITTQVLSRGTWNICGLKKSGAELMEDLETRQVHLCCLQECKVNKEEHLTSRNGGHLIMFKPNQAAYGLGFYADQALWEARITVETKNDRIGMFSFKLRDTRHGKRDLRVAVVNVYAPHSGNVRKDSECLTKFYDELQEYLNKLKNDYTVVMVVGDWNAKLGRKRGTEVFMGSHGRGYRNEHGNRMSQFLANNRLIAANTAFRHRWHHVTTFEPYTNTSRHQIDYICIQQRYARMLMDARTYNKI
jgi:exonuclease III